MPTCVNFQCPKCEAVFHKARYSRTLREHGFLYIYDSRYHDPDEFSINHCADFFKTGEREDWPKVYELSVNYKCPMCKKIIAKNSAQLKALAIPCTR